MPVSAAQSYVLTFTQAPAQEFADSPVRVQAVLPWFLRTTWWDGSEFDPGQLPDNAVMTPQDAAADHRRAIQWSTTRQRPAGPL
jgi:short-subunit dehydrogenase